VAIAIIAQASLIAETRQVLGASNGFFHGMVVHGFGCDGACCGAAGQCSRAADDVNRFIVTGSSWCRQARPARRPSAGLRLAALAVPVFGRTRSRQIDPLPVVSTRSGEQIAQGHGGRLPMCGRDRQSRQAR
jgi:hypothetical protein